MEVFPLNQIFSSIQLGIWSFHLGYIQSRFQKRSYLLHPLLIDRNPWKQNRLLLSLSTKINSKSENLICIPFHIKSIVFILHFIKYTVEKENLQKATSGILINQHLNIPMDIKRFPCFASLFEQIYQLCNTFFYQRRHLQIRNIFAKSVIAGSLESAYSLNWVALEIWGQGGGETLALL